MRRFRATAAGYGRCAFVWLIAVLALFPACAPSVWAADDDEVAIGTFELGAAPRANQSVEPRQGGDRSASSGEAEAARRFREAVAAHEAGEHVLAQRLFERLIAEAPDSPLARDSRAHLAELYRTPEIAGNSPLSSPGRGTPSPRETENRAADAGYGGGVVVPAALEEHFIGEAGDRVFFSAGSAELGSRARGVLQAQARFIKQRPDLVATIEGHSDDPPLSFDEQMALSAERAKAVRERLIAEGIDAERLTVQSLGRARRVSECAEPACTAQNRRVVTVLFWARSRHSGGRLDARPDTVPLVARNPASLTH